MKMAIKDSLSADEKEKLEEDYEIQMDTYMHKESSIHMLIMASVPEAIQHRITSSDMAQEMWDTLCGLHTQATRCSYKGRLTRSDT